MFCTQHVLLHPLLLHLPLPSHSPTRRRRSAPIRFLPPLLHNQHGAHLYLHPSSSLTVPLQGFAEVLRYISSRRLLCSQLVAPHHTHLTPATTFLTPQSSLYAPPLPSPFCHQALQKCCDMPPPAAASQSPRPPCACIRLRHSCPASPSPLSFPVRLCRSAAVHLLPPLLHHQHGPPPRPPHSRHGPRLRPQEASATFRQPPSPSVGGGTWGGAFGRGAGVAAGVRGRS